MASNNLSDEEKSQTFRKRRLSLSRHNIAPDSDASTSQHSIPVTAAATAATAADGNRDDPPLPEVQVTAAPPENSDNDSPSATATAAAETSDMDHKAQTFRKRRLSLTLQPRATEETGSGREDGNPKDQDLSTPDGQLNNIHYPAPKRRASDASANSNNSQNSDRLRVRTLHAGEILGQNVHPPSPALNPINNSYSSNNLTASGDQQEPHVLYRMSRPASSTILQSVAESPGSSISQPKWKKRITRKHDEDERKLPFPRDVVGTYSCHGVEPVYDSDYEHDEEEDDDDWTEDISGGASKLVVSSNPFHSAMPKEPKPTTAAKINQDRGGVASPYGNCARTALFAAYDGHGQGGELVSQFALHEIQSRLEKHAQFNTNLEKAFIDTFLAVDEALQEEPLIEPLYAGTTACVALLRQNILTVANAGDSRAVIARKMDKVNGGDGVSSGGLVHSYKAIDLTVDQNPDLPDERKRIENMGGFVSPPPEPGLSARVWLDEGFSQIGLAMARSIGDHAVAQVGVIAEPVVTTHTVENEDEFLIIATDGVWEFLSSEEAVEIVGANLPRGATKATQALIEAAAARWHDEEGDYRDDITALVIRLQELFKDQSISSRTIKS